SGVVSPAHEHGDAAAHDVEPRPLLLHQARAPARERPRRRRRRAPPPSPPLSNGAAFSPAPLLAQLPLLIH
ncbi:unnamed protein product, partial [Musa acuminata var. zebrina]